MKVYVVVAVEDDGYTCGYLGFLNVHRTLKEAEEEVRYLKENYIRRNCEILEREI